MPFHFDISVIAGKYLLPLNDLLRTYLRQSYQGRVTKRRGRNIGILARDAMTVWDERARE